FRCGIDLTGRHSIVSGNFRRLFASVKPQNASLSSGAHPWLRARAERGLSSPMPLGFDTAFSEFSARVGPGPFEFKKAGIEGSNGSWLGESALAPLGEAGFGDPRQETLPSL